MDFAICDFLKEHAYRHRAENFTEQELKKCYCTAVGANNSKTDLLLHHIEHNSYLLISVISRYAIFCHVILKDLSFLCSYIVRLDLWQNSYSQNI